MKLCIGNLPWHTTSSDLYTLLQPFGEVQEATVVFDSDTLRSRGYGLAEMSETDCNKIVKALNGFQYFSYALIIQKACP